MSNVQPLLDDEQQALVAQERTLPRARAESIAHRTRTADLVDDMESAGDEGLYWAGYRYSPVLGTPFHSFAQLLIDRSIFRLLTATPIRRFLPLAS